MYARLVLITIGPGKRETADQLIAGQHAALSAEKGFVRGIYLADDEKGQYGGLILWETKEGAEAAFAKLYPPMQEAIKDIVTGPPMTTLFEVVEPSA